MQPASGLFIVAVASKTSHDAQVSPLIGFTEDLFTALSASADAVKDPDRRDEAGQVRICLPFDSQHVAKTELRADSIT
jgi:hypothetical protein